MNHFKKTMLAAVVTLSTASVFYAQQDNTAKSKDIEQVVLVGKNLTQVAKERKTPVAVSTIKASEIQEKLSNREFPEIVKSTPSVYVTKTGGGYGDGRINVRGFDAVNIAVLINGQPVNDMENGKVYWSNWSGLGDIASSIQIQRGLGASKLVVPSVGGTFNVVTKATESNEGGMIKAETANNNFYRITGTYSTGISKSGWGTSVLLSRWQGDGYIKGTEGEGYTWFFSTGFKPNENHQFNFIATGAPQIHNTRRFATLADLEKNGIDYNPQYGTLNGVSYNMPVNFYHKPIASFNWDWTISPSLKMSTVIYGSWGRGGGGGGITGKITNAEGKEMNYMRPDGSADYDMVYNYNSGIEVKDYSGNIFRKSKFTAPNGASSEYNGKNIITHSDKDGIYRKQGVNSHNWYGGIIDLNYKPSANWSFNGGIDLRYYKGLHYDVVTDLLGADGVYVKKGDANYPNGYFVTNAVHPAPFTNLSNNQKVTYNNDGLVKWGGVYGQVEYSTKQLSAFFQGAVSQQQFKRVDHFAYKNGDPLQETDWNKKTGYVLKTGLNLNIDEHHNIFANTGLISRQPFFAAVYPNNGQKFFDAKNERIFSIEVGYGFRSKYIDINLNAYRTNWDNRFLSRNFKATERDLNQYPELTKDKYYTLNAVGLGQLHSGIEFEAKARPTSFLKLRGMLSLGNWKYNGNAKFDLINEDFVAVNKKEYTLNVDGLKVGDAAQTTASIGADINFTKNISIDANWEYYSRLYAQFNPIYFTSSAEKDRQVIQLPSYNLLDLGASFKFPLEGKKELLLRANVFNVLNTKYISELTSNNRVKTATDFKDTKDKSGNIVTAQQQYDTYKSNSNNFYKGIDTSNNGFFGFGRTWGISATFRF